ncbi:peptidoglycan-recognition protein SD-like [Haliotis cracherodii]|uniref:peptidoglycan-recognition protein SD-like n=1 Tax=Haliotis cracherodii TaxID=6455 RepID=UPI0039E914CE
MFRVLFSLLLATFALGMKTAGKRCACASVDTEIEMKYGSSEDNFGLLQSPNCLPYQGHQEALDDGRIYANVSYYGQPAWVLTSDIYIKDCYDSFDCVCVKEDVDVHESHDTSGVPLATLTTGQCRRIQGDMFNCTNGTFVPVQHGSKIGWIMKGEITFHKECLTDSHLAGCPVLITRSEWGARPAHLGVGTLVKTPDYVIIHHGATAGCNNKEDCVKIMQSYQNFHLDGRGWSDIGYNFAIGDDGNVYEGRGWDAVGAHTGGCNSKSIGIVFIGNFNNREPSEAALDALKKILECGVRNGKLMTSFRLLGRRDVTIRFWSESPGDKLYAIIQKWKHYNATDACA